MHLDPILGGLNALQYEAVTADPTCPLQIVAGPGTGKTTVIASRVAYLLVEKKIPPHSILVTTFTKKAAKEMTERIVDLLRPFPEIPVSNLFIGTFHSVCIRLLRRFTDKVGLIPNFKVADETDSKSVLREITPGMETKDRERIRREISRIKSSGLPSPSRNDDVMPVYSAYQEYLHISGLLDFDDLLVYGLRLASSDSSCLNFLQHVLVDEFQDTNKIQLKLMIELARKANNCVTVVGDPDQSIYGFRNADYTNFAQMEAHYKNLSDGRFRRVALSLNYRSTSAIIEASEQILESHVGVRPQRKLRAVNSLKMPVVYSTNQTNVDEARKLVGTIKMLHNMKDLFSFSDFAILLRTRFQSRVIEQELMKQGIPYHLEKSLAFWGLKIVRTMLDYLRVVQSDNDILALSRTINYPPRKVGDVTLKHLLEKLKQNLSITDVLRAHRPLKSGIQEYLELIEECRQEGLNLDRESVLNVYDTLAQKTNIAKHVNEEKQKRLRRDLFEDEKAEKLLADLRKQIEEFQPAEETFEELKVPTEISFLDSFLESVAIYQPNKPELSDVVTISTIHAAKGLEWPVVFVPGVSEGIFPSLKSSSIPNDRGVECASEEGFTSDSASQNYDEDVRCLFVAVTRAKRLLVLSSFESWDLPLDRLRPSPFLRTLVNFEETLDSIDENQRKTIYNMMEKPYQPPSQSEMTKSLTSSFTTASNFTSAAAALGFLPMKSQHKNEESAKRLAPSQTTSALKSGAPQFVKRANTGNSVYKRKRLGMRRPMR